MNKGFVSKISVLMAAVLLSGCAGLPAHSPANAEKPPILSAADAQAQIQVTIKPLQPVAEKPELVAAID